MIMIDYQAERETAHAAGLAAGIAQERERAISERPYPDVLSDIEAKKLLSRSEDLWNRLEQNDIGGYSGINRPFYILHEFRVVIEEFSRRDTGLNWSKNQLDAAAAIRSGT